MIGSGWRIYNDDVLFGWLRFPDFLVIGKWAQCGLQWHFFGMWIFGLNENARWWALLGRQADELPLLTPS
jgi:thiosulfate reductase cytochrome b subunit